MDTRLGAVPEHALQVDLVDEEVGVDPREQRCHRAQRRHRDAGARGAVQVAFPFVSFLAFVAIQRRDRELKTGLFLLY